MAGRDKTKAAIASVGEKEEQLWSLIEEGRGLPYVSKAIGIPRYYIREWLKQDPKRQERYQDSRCAAAETLVDKARDVLEGADINRSSLAKATAEQYRWQASRLDRDQWGDKPTVAIQINHHSSFAESMRNVLGDQTEARLAHEPKSLTNL